MKSNKYDELKEKQQVEYNAFPVHFAFGDKQIKDKFAELNLSIDENSERYYKKHITGIGFGGFILNKDVNAYNEMIQRHSDELKNAINEDKTGNGFIFDMFVSELANHEYGYTGNIVDTLNALGLSEKDFESNKALRVGLASATEYFNKDREPDITDY